MGLLSDPHLEVLLATCAKQQLKKNNKNKHSLKNAIRSGYYGYTMVTKVTYVLRSVQLSHCKNDDYYMCLTNNVASFCILKELTISFEVTEGHIKNFKIH